MFAFALFLIINAGSILIFPRYAAFCAEAAGTTGTSSVSPEAASLYEKALNDYKAGRFDPAYRRLKFILNNYETGKTLSSDVYFLCGKILYPLISPDELKNMDRNSVFIYTKYVNPFILNLK